MKSGMSPMLIGAIAVVVLLLGGGGIAAWQVIEAKRVAQAEQIRIEREKKEAELR